MDERRAERAGRVKAEVRPDALLWRSPINHSLPLQLPALGMVPLPVVGLFN